MPEYRRQIPRFVNEAKGQAVGPAQTRSVVGAYDTSGLVSGINAFLSVSNDRLDHVAVKEGERAGALVGMHDNLSLRDNFTLYGSAYNSAALATYANRKIIDLDNSVNEIKADPKYSADPVAMNEAINKVVAKHREGIPDWISPKFDLTVAAKRGGAIEEARSNQRGLIKEQNEAAFQASSYATINSLADSALKGDIKSVEVYKNNYFAMLDAQGPAELGGTGVMTPKAIEIEKQRISGLIQKGVVTGEFRRMPLDKKVDFLHKFYDVHTGVDKKQLERTVAVNTSAPTPKSGPNVGAMVQGISNAASAAGLNPAIVLGIANIENGGSFSTTIRPIGKDGKQLSSAVGLFQMIRGTRKRYGISGNGTASQQIQSGVQLTAENTASLKRTFGREPTPGEVYTAHFLGLGGARTVFRYSSDTSLKFALDQIPKTSAAAIMKANPFMHKMTTVGDFRRWSENKMAASMKKFGGTYSPTEVTGEDGESVGILAYGMPNPAQAPETAKASSYPSKKSEIPEWLLKNLFPNEAEEILAKSGKPGEETGREWINSLESKPVREKMLKAFDEYEATALGESIPPAVREEIIGDMYTEISRANSLAESERAEKERQRKELARAAGAMFYLSPNEDTFRAAVQSDPGNTHAFKEYYIKEKTNSDPFVVSKLDAKFFSGDLTVADINAAVTDPNIRLNGADAMAYREKLAKQASEFQFVQSEDWKQYTSLRNKEFPTRADSSIFSFGAQESENEVINRLITERMYLKVKKEYKDYEAGKGDYPDTLGIYSSIKKSVMAERAEEKKRIADSRPPLPLKYFTENDPKIGFDRLLKDIQENTAGSPEQVSDMLRYFRERHGMEKPPEEGWVDWFVRQLGIE